MDEGLRRAKQVVAEVNAIRSAQIYGWTTAEHERWNWAYHHLVQLVAGREKTTKD